MTVDAIMSRDVVTVPPDTALIEIRSLLHEQGFRHLLVVQGDDALRGVISDRDVLRALSPFLDTYSEEYRDVKTLSKPASDVMRTEPITATPDTPTEDAAKTLLDNSISALPVVKNGTLVGIITTKDLLQHYANDS